RAIEPISLQPRIQAILWGSAASLSHKSTHRTRQGPVGGSDALGDGYRVELGLQRDELVHNGLPQVDRCDPAPLPQKPRIDQQCGGRSRELAEPCRISNIP